MKNANTKNKPTKTQINWVDIALDFLIGASIAALMVPFVIVFWMLSSTL